MLLPPCSKWSWNCCTVIDPNLAKYVVHWQWCVCTCLKDRESERVKEKEPSGSTCHLRESGPRCKVSGASEEHQGERLTGDTLHLVTIETGRRHDNGCDGLEGDAQRQWAMSIRVRVRVMWVGEWIIFFWFVWLFPLSVVVAEHMDSFNEYTVKDIKINYTTVLHVVWFKQ